MLALDRQDGGLAASRPTQRRCSNALDAGSAQPQESAQCMSELARLLPQPTRIERIQKWSIPTLLACMYDHRQGCSGERTSARLASWTPDRAL